MKNACTTLFGLVLAVCLTLYGPISMANAGGSAVFSMEICADGVAKTVAIGADGAPIEPTHNCTDCLTCCHAVGAMTPTFGAAVLSIALLEMEADSPLAQDPILNKRNVLPVPRGPPAVYLSMLSLRT